MTQQPESNDATQRLVLADAQPVYLLGLRALLADQSEFEITASCMDGDEALRLCLDHPPDILLMDLQLVGRDGLSLLRELQAANLKPKTVILTASLDSDVFLELIRLGVRGVLLKTMPAHLIVQCLHAVRSGGEWLERQAAGLALERLLKEEAQGTGATEVTRLTKRERELMRLAAQGLTNAQIAAYLHIHQGTVKSHLNRVFAKLGIKNRVGLSLLARERGWI